MSRRLIAATLVVLVLVPLLAGGSLWLAIGRPGPAYTLTVRLWNAARVDLIVSKCTARQPGRILLLHTDFKRRNRLADARTTVLVGGRVMPPCP